MTKKKSKRFEKIRGFQKEIHSWNRKDLITTQLELNSKIEQLKIIGIGLPAFSAYLVIFSLMVQYSKVEFDNLYNFIFGCLLVFSIIIVLWFVILVIQSKNMKSWVYESHAITNELEQRKKNQDKIDQAYEDALCLKKQIAIELEKTKMISAQNREDRLKAKYLSKH